MRRLGRIDVADLRRLVEQCDGWDFQPGDTGHPLRRVFTLPTDWQPPTDLARLIAQLPPATLRRARLSRLLSGGFIPWHSDFLGIRVHVPIETNEHAVLHLGDTTWRLQVGEVWAFSPQQVHSAVNLGPTPRTHLVLDLVELDNPRLLR